MDKLYRLKHVPSGYYWQPHKHRGCHLSNKGKVYQNKTHGLSNHINNFNRYGERYALFNLFGDSNCNVVKSTPQLNWQGRKWKQDDMIAVTNLHDWVKEYLDGTIENLI